jgi:hypothetical protein
MFSDYNIAGLLQFIITVCPVSMSGLYIIVAVSKVTIPVEFSGLSTWFLSNTNLHTVQLIMMI